jgi:hypothetical protein
MKLPSSQSKPQAGLVAIHMGRRLNPLSTAAIVLCMYHLGYNAVQSVESQPTFRRNEREPSMKADGKQGGEMFFRNVNWLSTDYAALCPRR